MSPFSVNVSLVLLGVLLHLGYFRRAEHHMYALRYLAIGINLWLGTAAVAKGLGGSETTILAALWYATVAAGTFLSGLYGSLVLTRLYFHPLGKFPGPVLARISSLWWSTQVWRGDAHHRIAKLHLRYGPIVRVGSNDVSIADPAGIPAVYGPGSLCRKATWYDEDAPRRSIHTSRDVSFHQQRRRIWSAGFGDRALRDYETRVSRLNDTLVALLASRAGNAVNASQYVNWWAFDIMGDLAFNSDFGLLEKAAPNTAIDMLHEAMAVQRWKLPTWIFRVLVAIPGLTSKYWSFIKYCDRQLEKRLAQRPETPDIMTTLIKALEKDDSKESMLHLQADARTIIVAGSDTTAATLTHILYELSRHPEEAEKVREEVRTLRADSANPIRHVDIVKADHLNGVINEALRLHPVPPSAITRKTPTQGLRFGSHFIPGDVTVSCPQIVLGYSTECFLDPDRFIPERWYSKPELIRDRSGFAPFSLGVYACIGKPLALMQLRTVLVRLLDSFDIMPSESSAGDRFIAETRDQFTYCLADLPLRFCLRNQAAVEA